MGVSMGGRGGVRGACGGFKEKESLAPLYYPDTLVNPDTLWNNFEPLLASLELKSNTTNETF